MNLHFYDTLKYESTKEDLFFMASIRDKKAEFLQLLTQHAGPQFAEFVATKIVNDMKEMKEQKQFDFNKLQTMRTLIDSLFKIPVAQESLTFIPEIEKSTLQFLESYGISGPEAVNKLAECVEKLKKNIESGITLPLYTFKDNLVNFFYFFIDEDKQHQFMIQLLQGSEFLDDKLLSPVRKKYAQIKEELFDFWKDEISEIENLSSDINKEQLEGLTNLENDLFLRLTTHVQVKDAQIKLQIRLAEISTSGTEYLTLLPQTIEEFKKQIDPILNEIFRNWLDQKLDAVKTFFRNRFSKMKDSIISQEILQATLTNVGHLIKREKPMTEVKTSEVKHPDLDIKLFASTAHPEQKAIQDSIQKINEEIFKFTDGSLKFNNKVSSHWNIPCYSLSLYSNYPKEIEEFIKFIESNKITFLKIVEINKGVISIYIPLTRQNLAQMNKASYEKNKPGNITPGPTISGH